MGIGTLARMGRNEPLQGQVRMGMGMGMNSAGTGGERQLLKWHL